jgi:hypothetical protein
MKIGATAQQKLFKKWLPDLGFTEVHGVYRSGRRAGSQRKLFFVTLRSVRSLTCSSQRNVVT